MSRGKLVLFTGVGALAIYFMVSPYIALYQMKSAAENHDGTVLSKYIEFPSVRQSLKDQMNAMFANKMATGNRGEDNAMAAFGAAFAGAIVDKMVDTYVTPAGITQLMAGGTLSGEDDRKEDSPDSSKNKLLANAALSYEGFDRFAVTVKGEDGKEAKFILRRRGLGWKLTDIIIPLEPATALAPAESPAPDALTDQAISQEPAAPSAPAEAPTPDPTPSKE